MQTTTDDYGRTVAYPTHPQRIVSTSPAITEIICALGAQELLVGRTDFCSYPPTVSNIESIGGISNLNIEKVVSLRPDLVISGSMVPKKSTEQLEKMHVPIVCVIEQQRFEGLFDNITKVGHLIGYEREADSLNSLLRSRYEALAHTITAPLPSVYYVVGYGKSGNFTASGNTFINDIIEHAGGYNVAADINGWEYSLEALLTADPDYIVIRREDSASFCRMMPYTQLTAVKSGHVIALESGTIDLQVPRNIDCIELLSQKLHQ